jgi:hypothetical protein
MLTFPYSTDHQTVTNFANSAKEVLEIAEKGARTDLIDIHGQRIHELMRFRSHTVNTDGF